MRDGRALVTSSRSVFSMNKAAAEARAARSRSMLKFTQSQQKQQQNQYENADEIRTENKITEIESQTRTKNEIPQVEEDIERRIGTRASSSTTLKTTSRGLTPNTNANTTTKITRKPELSLMNAEIMRYRVKSRNREVSERKQVGDAEEMAHSSSSFPISV